MKQYLDMVRHVLDHGDPKPTGARLKSTGGLVGTRSVFGYQTRYDLNEGFPLVTVKPVPFRQVAVELTWYLRGSTSLKYLHDNCVGVWDQWADENNEVRNTYPRHWRRWGHDWYDQIGGLTYDVREVSYLASSRAARRLMLISYDPKMARQNNAPPIGCHTLFQLDIRGQTMNGHLYQRSGDLLLGVPWNVGCYALLLHLFARFAGLTPGTLIHSFGDLHIYDNHIEAARLILGRDPYPHPTLVFQSDVKKPQDFHPADVVIEGYKSHPYIPLEVAV